MFQTREETWPTESIILDPAQVARHDKERIRFLADDILANGLHQRIGVVPEKLCIYGAGRAAAMMLAGIKQAPVKVYLGVNPSLFQQIRLVENLLREDLTDQQKVHGAIELMKLNPGWTRKDCAANLRVNASSVTRWLSYLDGTPDTQRAFDSGAINLTQMYGVTQEDDQAAALVHALNGVNLSGIKAAGRQQRNGHSAEASERIARAKLPLPGGTVITVAAKGEGVTVSEIIEALTAVLKECKEAERDGISAKSLQKVLADKAKGGG